MTRASATDAANGSMSCAARSDTGRVRSRNEDSFLVRPPLFIVADGMGGEQAGEVASALAVRLIGEELADREADLLAAAAAVEAANALVWNEAAGRSDRRGMGTTCTVALVDGNRVHVVHVGDSRAYRWRDGRLEQLTTDHTLVASLVGDGTLTPAEARVDDRRHIITRALGAERDVLVDRATHGLLPGDRLLLCSDGLSGQVDEGTIGGVLATERDPAAAADRLVELANAAGGIDNVTAIVVDRDRLGTGDASAPTPPATRTRGTRRIRYLLIAAALVGLLALMAALYLRAAMGPGQPQRTPSGSALSTGGGGVPDQAPTMPSYASIAARSSGGTGNGRSAA